MWHWLLLRHFWCILLLLAALPKFLPFSHGCACISPVLQSQFQMSFLSPSSPRAVPDHCSDRRKHRKWTKILPGLQKTSLDSKKNSLAGSEGSCGSEEGPRHCSEQRSERWNNPSSSSLSKTFLSSASIMQLKPLINIQFNRMNTGLGSVFLQQEGKALQRAGSWVKL